MPDKAGLTSEADIKELVRLSQEGDDDAFGLIYDILADQVYKFIYIRVRHKETAEDLLSVTFLKVWQNIDKYQTRENAKFSTWLFKLCLNVIYDHLRKKKLEVNFEDYMENGRQINNEGERIDQALSLKKIQAALWRLPDDYQNVLNLRFVNQFSLAETAEVLGRSNGAVRVLQVRALRKLRKLIV